MFDTELLKSRVKADVRFSFYRDGELWYRATDGWEFPIPVADTSNTQGGSPTFLAVEKGIVCMRWMRKHMEREAAWKVQAAEATEDSPGSFSG